MNSGSRSCAGVDGCPGGFICAAILHDGSVEFELCNDIAEVWEKYQACQVILLDMPIGLPEGEIKSRDCDREARKILKRRACCVFSPP